jgi:CO/xanthine dehydrogenase Mo-binding subunit
METHIVESREEEGPFGAKGVGEFVQIPTAAAIANAVYDAIGVRIYDLPITPDKVLAALGEKKGARS